MDSNTTGRIINAMEAVERSKKWTAEKAGIPVTTFHRKLRTGGDFTINELGRIAEALTIHPAELLPSEFQKIAAAS